MQIDNIILENKMSKYDEQLQAVEKGLNDNIQRLRELLYALSINDLYRETDDIRQLHNQQVEKYNHLSKRAAPVASALNEELTIPELMQQYIKLYTDGNQIAITIKTFQQSEKAMDDYLRITGKKPAEKETNKTDEGYPDHNITQTPFQSHIATLCHEYGQLFEKKQTILVLKEMQKEKEKTFEKYSTQMSSFRK